MWLEGRSLPTNTFSDQSVAFPPCFCSLLLEARCRALLSLSFSLAHTHTQTVGCSPDLFVNECSLSLPYSSSSFFFSLFVLLSLPVRVLLGSSSSSTLLLFRRARGVYVACTSPPPRGFPSCPLKQRNARERRAGRPPSKMSPPSCPHQRRGLQDRSAAFQPRALRQRVRPWRCARKGSTYHRRRNN